MNFYTYQYFYVLLLFATSLQAFERITHFDSDITVQCDSTLVVKETIDVVSEGKQVRRGIVRKLPTTYDLYLFFNYNIDLTVKEEFF